MEGWGLEGDAAEGSGGGMESAEVAGMPRDMDPEDCLPLHLRSGDEQRCRAACRILLLG